MSVTGAEEGRCVLPEGHLGKHRLYKEYHFPNGKVRRLKVEWGKGEGKSCCKCSSRYDAGIECELPAGHEGRHVYSDKGDGGTYLHSWSEDPSGKIDVKSYCGEYIQEGTCQHL